MTTQRYTGSCQCGRVRYAADIDFDATSPSGDGATVLIKPEAFWLLTGEEDLSDIQFAPVVGHNRFCRHCGIRPFGKGHLAVLGGDFCAINLLTLDQIATEESDLLQFDAAAS